MASSSPSDILTNNTEARACEVLAAHCGWASPATAMEWIDLALDGKLNARSASIGIAVSISAMLAYGNERAAQEREANAAIVSEMAEQNRVHGFHEDYHELTRAAVAIRARGRS